jgi:hypothetical protein
MLWPDFDSGEPRKSKAPQEQVQAEFSQTFGQEGARLHDHQRHLHRLLSGAALHDGPHQQAKTGGLLRKIKMSGT